MEFYSVVKMSKLLLHATTWMSPRIILWSEKKKQASKF